MHPRTADAQRRRVASEIKRTGPCRSTVSQDIQLDRVGVAPVPRFGHGWSEIEAWHDPDSRLGLAYGGALPVTILFDCHWQGGGARRSVRLTGHLTRRAGCSTRQGSPACTSTDSVSRRKPGSPAGDRPRLSSGYDPRDRTRRSPGHAKHSLKIVLIARWRHCPGRAIVAAHGFISARRQHVGEHPVHRRARHGGRCAVGHVRCRRRIPDDPAADLLRHSADCRRRVGRDAGYRR